MVTLTPNIPEPRKGSLTVALAFAFRSGLHLKIVMHCTSLTFCALLSVPFPTANCFVSTG